MTENIVNYLRKQLRKEKEYRYVMLQIENVLIGGVYLNKYSEGRDAQVFSKQLAWAGIQKRIKELWSVISENVPLYLDVEGAPNVGSG